MKGFRRNFKPLEILTEEQIESIHQGTLEVLERTGLRIEHERALKLLDSNGCNVDYNDNRVRFPSGLVEESLRRCPSSFRMKARNSKDDLAIGGNIFLVTTFPGLQTVDLETWEPRPPTRKEFYDGVTVLDALDNIHYISSYNPYFGFKDVPPVMCIPEGFAARARNSTKVMRTATSNDSEIFTINIAKAVGSDAMVAITPSPPLTYYINIVEAIYRGVEADFPLSITNGDIMGATGPATTAGTLLTSSAEMIGAIVIAQLIKPGAKILVTNFVLPQNMQSGMPIFGAIQCASASAVYCQYFRRFGIPVQVSNAGGVSSKRIDFQCGYEKATLALIAALCGANIIYFAGGIFSELTHHPVQAILDNDVVGMIGRFLQGVEVNDETLAIDLIEKVGPIPGHFLGEEHTRKWWKLEQFVPKAADRLTYPEWMSTGKKSCLDYAKERMEEILATHKPTPLTPGQEEDVERILEEARQYYKESGMISEEEMATYRESMKSPSYPYE